MGMPTTHAKSAARSASFIVVGKALAINWVTGVLSL